MDKEEPHLGYIHLWDIWHSNNFQRKRDYLLFSWSDGRISGLTLSHIDHIYVGEALEAKGGWFRITPGTTLSRPLPGNRSFSIASKVGPIPTSHPAHDLHSYRGEGTIHHPMVITRQWFINIQHT